MALFKSSATRNHLIETAINVLSQNPTASMSDIAEAAGVQRMTLNRQLGTRENMMKIIAQTAIKEIDQACIRAASKEKTAINQFKAVVKTLVSLSDRVHFFWQFPEENSGNMFDEELQSHDEELSELIYLAKKEGAIKNNIPNEWILASMDALIVSAHNMIMTGKISKKEATEYTIETLFSGIES